MEEDMDREKRTMWGREFDVVSNGLDIAQVIAYIEEVRKVQNPDAHIDSLKRLAESTVAEADRIAQEIREEAKVEAKAKAIEIINEAEAKLQQVIKAKEKTERAAQQKAIDIIANAEKQKHLVEEQARSIIEDASSEAATIRDGARERANKDLERFKEQASEKLRDDIRMVHQKLIADLVSLAAEVRILESKWEGLKIEDVEQGTEPSSITSRKELNTSPPADIQEYLQRMNGEVDHILTDKIKDGPQKGPNTEEEAIALEPKEELDEILQSIKNDNLPEEEAEPIEEIEEADDPDDFFGILIEAKGAPEPAKQKPEKSEAIGKKAKTEPSKPDIKEGVSPKYADTSSKEKPFDYPKTRNTAKATFSDIEDLTNPFGMESDAQEELMSIDQLRESLESGRAEWKDQRLVSELEDKSADNPILKGLKRSLTNALGFVKGKR